MRALIQRVLKAKVSTSEGYCEKINEGLLILLGIENADNKEDVDWLSNKIVNLRIFNDNEGVMNNSLLETKGNIMIISQFTLHARTKKGHRPSYIDAAPPDIAIPLYQYFIEKIETLIGKNVSQGVFGAYMQVELVNDGPVTIMIDTKNR
ncbi:MAG: D-aminoacyl-tRNA deacylase [Marinilabiliaceae bacterium]|nr:D-aminoacyl-tRNA deacylase [Marinilabiliaceae bacterium]